MLQERLRRRIGASMRFNAATSYIRLGVQPGLDRGARTYACLCYPLGAGEGGAAVIFGQTGPGTTINGPRWVIEDGTSQPFPSFRSSSTTNAQFPARNAANNSCTYNALNLLVTTWDGSLTATGIRHYVGINGAFPTETGYGGTVNGTGAVVLNSTFNVYLGNRQDLDRTFNGDLFYVAVWNRIISTQELRDLAAFGPLAVDGVQLMYAEHEDFGALGIAPRAIVDVIPGSMPRGVSEVELGERAESMLGGVRIDATANGVTISAGCSLIGGSAAAASTASGQVLPVTVTIQAGAASGGGNATAGGVTIVVSSSLIPGAAAASSTRAGVTVGPTVSLIAGAASAASTAPGATLPVTVSLQAGAASGGGSATASGVTISVGVSMLAGSVAASSVAGGAVMGPTVTLQPGSASGAGNAVAGGVSLTVAQSFIAGAVAAAAQAQGTIRTITASLIPGAAYGPGAPPAEPGNIVRTPQRRRTVYYGKD